MLLTKRVSLSLITFGVWSWIIWPTFIKNIWADPRSWHNGMTAFFGVHLALTVVSLVAGTWIGALGIRGVRHLRSSTGESELPVDDSLSGRRRTPA